MNLAIVLTAIVSSLVTMAFGLGAFAWLLRRRLTKSFVELEERERVRLTTANAEWQRKFDRVNERIKGSLGTLSQRGETALETDQREKQNMLGAMRGLTSAILRLESRVSAVERRAK